MKTLKQIISILEEWQESNPQLNSFEFDNPTEISTKDMKYPAMWATVTDTEVYKLSFDIIFFDIVEDDRTNIPDVMSDMLSVCYDFVAYLEKYEDTDLDISVVKFLPFNQKYDDLTAGWVVNVQFEYINPFNCE